MATPRIFVSSTCYDLQEIRFQLRQFINSFGYEPAMSEFDDIFYSYELHVQDSCLEEISKCQMFVLIIGNNYGSTYHKEYNEDKIPDSVTLKEFRKALEHQIPKHICINKFVDYDYKNYKRALDKVVLKYFTENEITDDEVTFAKEKLKIQFDSTYPFPHDSYKYVFYFLDIVHDLKEGNAYNTFDSFEDIKESLKKQWAGFMYESLIKKDKKIDNSIKPVLEKLAQIDSNIKRLVDSKITSSSSSVSLDLTNLIKGIDFETYNEIKDKIASILHEIIHYEYLSYDEYIGKQRIWFKEKFNSKSTQIWLEGLKDVIKNYKWSKFISLKDLFKGWSFRYNGNEHSVSYQSILELYTIYESLDEGDKASFINTVYSEFNNYLDKEKDIPPPTSTPLSDDDLPF